ncbi:MAG: hypothetical protein AAGA96_06705 [Verrucomicrobiota bacterium]
MIPSTPSMAALLGVCLSTTTILAQDGSRLRQAFDRLDDDNDAKLSAAEISTAPQLAARLKDADEDGDGALTYEEFSIGVVRSLTADSPPTKPSASEASTIRTGEQTRTVTVEGVDRRYLVYAPESYDPDTPTAVVIAFHGGGGNPQTAVRIFELNQKSEEAGFLVVYPYGSNTDPDRFLTFNGGECCGYAMHQEIDDVAYTRAFLDDLESVAKVDRGRVFATGLSNGGIMSHRVGAELSDRIVAIAPVGGPLMLETIAPEFPVAVMHFHGTGDAFAPFEGGVGKNATGGPGVTDFRSVEFTLNRWIEANGCEATPVKESLPDLEDDGTTVVKKTWEGGKNGTEVVLVEIRGGGHTWPGVQPPANASFLGVSTMDVSANDLMWEFFQKHAREVEAVAEENEATGSGE